MKQLENIPKILYKYRNWGDDYHKRVLTSNEVFLASPANLNDPFDASLPFRYDVAEMTPENITKKLLITGRKRWPEIDETELHERAYREQFSGRFDDDAYWKDMHENNKEALHKDFGLLSLTRAPNNLLMWAHYANCHKGFCVGLDTDILYDTIGGTIGAVAYQNDFPIMPLFSEERQDIEAVVKMLNTKSPHWNYEEEYRVSKNAASNKVFTLPTEAIKEIIIGCNMSLADRESILQVVDKNLPKAELWEAKISLEKFELNLYKTTRITSI